MTKTAQETLDLLSNIRTADFVHTCASKEEFEEWLALQAKGNPQAGIFAMAGFNYAINQVQQIIDGTHPNLKKEDETNG